MNKFSKRTYTPRLFISDICFIALRLYKVFDAYRSARIPNAMAEKIMLAVTSVNECIYCARFHSSLAIIQGVDEQEVKEILGHEINKPIDDYEFTALHFAQHYAETNRNPEPEALENLYKTYGTEKADDILLFIRLIYVGNLAGNTFDGFLSRFIGKPPENGSIIFELLMILSAAIVVVPLLISVATFSFVKEWLVLRERKTNIQTKV